MLPIMMGKNVLLVAYPASGILVQNYACNVQIVDTMIPLKRSVKFVKKDPSLIKENINV